MIKLLLLAGNADLLPAAAPKIHLIAAHERYSLFGLLGDYLGRACTMGYSGHKLHLTDLQPK